MRFFIFIFTFFTFNLVAQEVSIMSYNIGSVNWNTTKDSVVGRILANDVDVICLNEAGGSKLSYLTTVLANYRLLQTFGNTPNQTSTHIFIKNAISVLDSGFVQTDTYVGYTGQDRFVNWGKLSYNNISFFVYANHFVSPYGTNADSAIIGQYRHANTMVQLMNSHYIYNLPQITCGDFNADSSKAVMQFLQHQTPITYNNTIISNPIILNDSWYLANPFISKPSTVSIGMANASIDWILTNTHTNVIGAFIDNSGVNINGLFPSDHFPIITIFTLSMTSINENYNLKKKLFKVVDILGRKTKNNKNTLLFYIYDDGKVEKRIVIE